MPSIHDHHLHAAKGSAVSAPRSRATFPAGRTPPGRPATRTPCHAFARPPVCPVRQAVPRFRDVVGVLECVDGQSRTAAWAIRTRPGDLVEVDPTVVVAAKVVPDTPARLRSASEVDVDSSNGSRPRAWQPLEQAALGDWVLRAAAGFTGRANSVLPLGDPGRPLDEALARRGAVVRRALTSSDDPGAAAAPAPTSTPTLGRRGWEACSPPVLRPGRRPRSLCHGLAHRTAPHRWPHRDRRHVPDAGRGWLASFRYGDAAGARRGRADHDQAPTTRSSSRSRPDDGTTLAIARGAITPGVARHHRGRGGTGRCGARGSGAALIAALADYAARHDVRHVFLQVAHDNAAARALYEQLGFVAHHDYVYRLAP